MSSDGSDNSAVASKGTQSTKSTRGKVCLHSVAVRRAKGIKEDVEFNAYGQPISDSGSQMQSYIGLLTREHVKVNHKSWREVPNHIKELIWESVKASYNVDDKWKDGCLKSANSKWRTWRTRLNNDFIKPNKGNPTKLYQPPPNSGILFEDWKAFVKTRISPEFEQLSQDQKARRMKNVYPHRLSRKGYARFAEEIKTDLHNDEEINRAKMWKKARVPKDGEVDNEDLKATIQKIDDYIHDKEEGKFVSKGGSEDLLTCALEKPEHSGRVRGVGAYVCPTTYFKTPRGVKHSTDLKSQHEMECARKKIEEQDGRIHVLDKLVSELLHRMGKIEAKPEHNELLEGRGSCSGKTTHNAQENEDVEIVEKSSFLVGKPVALLLGSSKKIVGYGTVVVAGNLLHGAPMPTDCFRVSVDEVVDGNALLPFRVSDDIETVESALATHVAWPIQMVVERSNETPYKKVEQESISGNTVKNLSSLPPSLRALYRIMEKSEQGLCITLDFDVFGLNVPVFILSEDVIPFCDLEPITGTCIVAYIWHLYTSMKEKGTNNKLLFVNPFSSASYAPKSSRDDRARVLADRLLNTTSNAFLLMPCNVGEHWILIIIEPYKGRVYLMDPLGHRNPDRNLKYVVDTAISIFNANKGKNFKKTPNWEIIKGPLQPDLKQCGYYVMRFMKEIVEGYQNADFISIGSLFQSDGEYSQALINEVREEWASCVILHYSIK